MTDPRPTAVVTAPLADHAFVPDLDNDAPASRCATGCGLYFHRHPRPPKHKVDLVVLTRTSALGDWSWTDHVCRTCGRRAVLVKGRDGRPNHYRH